MRVLINVFYLQNTILPQAVHFWEQALMVRKTENVIRLNRYKFLINISSLSKCQWLRSYVPFGRHFYFLTFVNVISLFYKLHHYLF